MDLLFFCLTIYNTIDKKTKFLGNTLNMKTILVTGGAGFIGNNFVRLALNKQPDWRIINLDALTYAGNPLSLEDLKDTFGRQYKFVRGNILDQELLKQIFNEEPIGYVVHFAAESHVDRSIQDPLAFVETNVTGTCNLLAVAHNAWVNQGSPSDFKFIQVSTDEVYGSLGVKGYFKEQTPYDPSSPYSASKAAADHLARAWFKTYDFPTIVTNCSNNFGPYQFPEKLIPLMILNGIEKKELPVYGTGLNVRDWLYVMDHCDALMCVIEKGVAGQTYLIGGGTEQPNITIVKTICSILDSRLGRNGISSSENLIRFVTDRPGHDFRYAIDATKINEELGWYSHYSFEDALTETVDWYLNNRKWVDSIRTGNYRKWIMENYEKR
jgi:dTDP-glucose 4,6-dehydratase